MKRASGNQEEQSKLVCRSKMDNTSGSNRYQGLVKSYHDIPENVDEDTFRIMITTDNHIGYKENDSYLELDSYNNFKEVLEICQDLGNVDFMLNSGDLFHENHFSSKNLNFITDLLVNSCFNDNPITFKTEHKPDYLCLNYDSENVNVGLPIFIINGNHDYGNSIGTENVSILKILSNLKLINYLGNFNITDGKDVAVEPVILKKGTTQLNLYGLSNIKEERLNTLIRNNKLIFLTNDEVTPQGLNVLLLHQNRSSNINKNYLNENLLPDFLDLLIWGHEHECIPDLAYNSLKNFNILQPGSTVQTSFHESELKPKHCFLMDFKDNTYTIYPIPLDNVRDMKVRSISLKEMNVSKDLEQISSTVINEVDEMIQEVKQSVVERNFNKKQSTLLKETGKTLFLTANLDAKQMKRREKVNNTSLLPLIRLKLDYTGYENISFRSINNRFIGNVANPGSILKLHKTYKRKPLNNVAQSVTDARSILEQGKKSTKLSANDQLVAIIKKSLGEDHKLIALDETNLLNFFSSNLSNSVTESKINMEKFINKEIDRVTKALVENTKDEMDKLSLAKTTQSQTGIKEQPLYLGTKNYKNLLKNVSSLLTKKLKNDAKVSLKRSLDSSYISSSDKPCYFDNKENYSIHANDDEEPQERLIEDVHRNQVGKVDTSDINKVIETNDLKNHDLQERTIKRPKLAKNILSSDSDDDFMINSDYEDSHIKTPLVKNVAQHKDPEIIHSESSDTRSDNDALIKNEGENSKYENAYQEKEPLVLLRSKNTDNINDSLIIVSSDENVNIEDERADYRNLAEKLNNKSSATQLGKNNNGFIVRKEILRQELFEDDRSVTAAKSFHNNNLKEAKFNVSPSSTRVTHQPNRAPPVRRTKLHINLLSSDSD